MRRNIVHLLEMLLEHLIFRRTAKVLERCKQFARVAPKSSPTETLFRSVHGPLEKCSQQKRYFTAPETHFVLYRLIRRNYKMH
jgi:hypothetical protein